jgi:hypothetical protein
MREFVAWATHGFRQRGWDVSPRVISLTLAMILVIGLLAGFRLFMVSQVDLAARHLQATRDTLIQLQQENALLEAAVAFGQPALLLTEAAQQMGLVPAERVIYLER